jgi:2-polyprenyl-6-methoxyphenol hydroxylase-like FAD-dependent oxidoreductase
MSEPVRHRHGHAVVIGASIAGLLAARVLSEHFERVTVVERDTLGDDPQARRGVPQGRHLHALLARGEQIMSELFPNLVPTLVTRGATPLSLGRDLRWYHFGCWKKHFDSEIGVISVTRGCLEQEVRRRVRALPNVGILDGTVVTRYLTDWEKSRIPGVCVRGRHGDTLEDEVRADLVVDAGGRGSQTPQRLAELGYRQPLEVRVDANVGYATRVYERPAGTRNWQSLVVFDPPPRHRGGLIFPIEGQRWMVTLVNSHGDYPPDDAAGFLNFAKSLSRPDVYDALATARPIGDIVTHRLPTNQRRYYERLARFPTGLLVMGDALCSFNPIFGQGMTVSALEAALLRDCLRELDTRRTPSLAALTCNFRSRVGRVVDPAWDMATGEDLRNPQARGPRPLKLKFLHWYTARVHRAAGASALVAERFYRAMNMLAPVTTLFGPDVLAELLRVAWRSPAREHRQHAKSEAHERELIERTATTTPATTIGGGVGRVVVRDRDGRAAR